MKTRKVGKIVSLLVAIVLVATIMIPAAGVLAAETPDRTVASNAELHSAIQFAYEKSLAGEITADRPYRVQLSGDIEVPTFGYTAIGTSYLDGREEWSRRGYIAAKTFVKDGVTYTNYQQEGSYEGTAIIIPENTYMVIDLNGHTIKLADAYQYGDKNKEEIGIANPGYNQVTYTNGAMDKSESLHPKGKGRTQDIIYKNGMASVITVLGQLTLKDTSSKKTGTITGGVGNVVEAGDRGSAVGKKYTGTDANSPTVHVLDYVETGIHHSGNSSSRVAGGGVYVKGENAVFNMEGGNITKNISWASQAANAAFQREHLLTAVGGGVAVEDGATFNMSGGSIYNNNARSYMLKNDADGGFSVYGGGVYLGTNATMNFTGGVIKENSTFSRMAYSTSGPSGTLNSMGGGIYVSGSALLNMYVNDEVDSVTDDTVPSVIGNTCGGVRKSGSKTFLHAAGAGIYAAEGSYVNIRRALITANGFYRLGVDFSDYDKAVKAGNLDENKWNFNAVARDESGKVHYQDGSGNTSYTNANGEVVDYVATDKYLAADGTKKYVDVITADNQVKDTWLYPLQPGNSKLTTYTNGGGMFVANDSVVNIGDGVWIYDNWDMITSTGDGITQDDVYFTRRDGAVDYSLLRLAAPATESKIGINDEGSMETRYIATESVRPTVVTEGKTAAQIKRQLSIKDSYDKVFEDYKGAYLPSQTDVQFFWCNGRNEFDSSQPEKSRPFRAVIFNDQVQQFNTNALVPISKAQLKFGDTSNAYSSDNYHGYVLRSFNEANLHQYANVNIEGEATWQNAKTALQDFPDYTFNNTIKTYTLTLSRPNYNIYKGDNWSNLPSINTVDGTATTVGTAGAPNSLAYSAELGGEASDLYFKSWQFYAPYGYKRYFDFMTAKTLGDQEYDLANDPEHFTHSFTSKQLITWNNNLLHQSVPTYTAMFYSASELAAARHDLSVTKGALLIGKDGKVYIRVAALLGGYMTDLQNVQPSRHTAADGTELYFNKPTFVASYTNATPTLEGGYKTTTQNGTPFEARIAKKLISNGTNNKVTLDTWNYVPGNNSAFANDAWTLWNAGKNHHNKNGDSSFLGIMWVDIDTGITYNSETNKLVGDTSKVIYVTPCIEVTDKSGSTHYSYYYGESRAYSVAQLLEADGGLNK